MLEQHSGRGPDQGTQAGSGLHRKLGGATAGAIAFSASGVSAGVFSLFGFSLGMGGPASLTWGWLLVGLGTFGICLMWAELASNYPKAAVMFDWPRNVANEGVAWWVGWVYLFAMMFQLAGIYLILPYVLLPLFDIEATTANKISIALGALIVAAVANIAAIERVGKLVLFAAIAELIITFGITLSLLFFGHEQAASTLVDRASPHQSFGAWLPAFLGGGIFLGLWVMQNFEAGGAIAEETMDAPRRAPRAILTGWLGTFVVGLFTIVTLLLAIPDLKQVMASPTPVVTIIDGSLAPWIGKLYLVLLSVVIILGANAVFTLVSRQMYGMARSHQLPFSRQLQRTHPRTGEPWVAVVATAGITAVPFAFSDQFAVLATGASATVYLIYLAMTLLLLVARFRGWPAGGAPMQLGRWGIPLNILVVLYTGAGFVDLMWFRDATNPRWHSVPVSVWMLALPIAVGLVYRSTARSVRLSASPELDLAESE
jgi:amino acid transporter